MLDLGIPVRLSANRYVPGVDQNQLAPLFLIARHGVFSGFRHQHFKQMKFIQITCDETLVDTDLARKVSMSNGVKMLPADLPIGDFVIGDRAVVLCKSAREFTCANMDRTMNFEVALIRESFDFAVLILDGDPFEAREFIEPIGLISTMAWLQANEGIHVIVSKTLDRTAMIIAAMAANLQQGPGFTPPLRCMKRKPHQAPLPGPLSRYVLEGLPGTRPDTAILLANHFGSVHGVANATLDDLKSVKGMGFKAAEMVYFAMRSGARLVQESEVATAVLKQFTTSATSVPVEG